MTSKIGSGTIGSGVTGTYGVVSGTCVMCAHSGVCKYKDQYLKREQLLVKQEEEMKKEFQHDESIFNISITCKYYLAASLTTPRNNSVELPWITGPSSIDSRPTIKYEEY